MFKDVRHQLKLIGMPTEDLMNLPSSNKCFQDGSNFRIEMPTINSVEAMESLVEVSLKLGITINRITETYGIFRHTVDEIKEMVQLCQAVGSELMMSTGPRASYDLSPTSGSSQGNTVAYRLRGQEQLIRAIEDIRRAIDLGVNSFLIYDEGLLSVLAQMRTAEFIPTHIKFKISAHCGHGNAASFKLMENLGANSINPVRDLSLPMLATLRQAVDIPIDFHIDNPPSSGGFIRVYEAPEIVRIASPVYLKTGNSAILNHGKPTTANDAIKMVRQAQIALEMVHKYNPLAKQSKSGNI